ncbi:class I alpha-mannosidase [Lindgomyces ingoldianus]|uniref:Class I alpha-mannosidase n=1 Tax=Lindgomyces ingoldianus TaxID=673940 RepID=A0ACB6QS68_9PLEO|nr:class I alpha-mannosidase [Lindgomyces ingoldianus]KAF2469682.1 class I alpha-mannosidase [Lindgomyces ingoldianus]
MVKIKVPRNGAYQPLSRRHSRNLVYALIAGLVIGLYYLCNGPIDPFAVSFEEHQAYMNDRAHVDGFLAKGSYDWRKAPFHNKPESFTPLPAGKPRTLPPIQFTFTDESKSRKDMRERYRVAVRNEFERNWNSYKRWAWTRDELMPVTAKGVDPFGGWGATLVDSLDSLWIMGFKDDFYEAVAAVAAIDFGKSEMTTISVFETTIRYLGGLLSAYDLSHEKVMLDKAIQLGEMLYRAFDTTNHMPLDRLAIDLAKKNFGVGFTADSSICFAGLGSLTMEFVRLAQITQQPKYYDAVARVTDLFDRVQNSTRIPGLFPTWANAYQQDLSYDRSFTLGAMADSSYEYFPKTFALLGGLEPVYEKLYKESASMIDAHMLFRPMLPDGEPGEDILYCGDVHASDPESISLDPEMQHLTCFVGGFFALAGRIFKNDRHVDLGAKLTEGCIYAYHSMPTGIMPEIFNVVPCKSRSTCPWNQTIYEEHVLNRATQYDGDFKAAMEELKLPKGFTSIRDRRYLLRPEAIESVFIMYRVTGNEEYLEHAWDMFTSIRKYSTTRYANGQVLDVLDISEDSEPEDKMESFWLAETLKYFYLIFSPPDMISLDEWVFNTEAHPFRRPKWIKLEG